MTLSGHVVGCAVTLSWHLGGALTLSGHVVEVGALTLSGHVVEVTHVVEVAELVL